MTRVRARPAVPAGYVQRVWALLSVRGGHILLIAALTCALDALRALPMIGTWKTPVSTAMFNIATSGTTMTAVLVIGISLAQALETRGWRRTLLMVAGGVAAAAALAALSTVWRSYTPFGMVTDHITSRASTAMYLAWQYSAVAIAAALFYAARERESQLATAARASELEQQRVQRTMLESRLAVLRARVEPEFLFAALGDVRELYLRDRQAADEMLDALIVYLRAALPQMRGEASTVGREVDLVAAYVAVLQVPRRAVLQCTTHAAIEARDVELPPMVLLPLVQEVFTGAEGARRRRFAIAAEAAGGGTAIRIEVEGGALPEKWRGDGPDTVMRTLRAYFGTAVSLRFSSHADVHAAQLQVAASAAW